MDETVRRFEGTGVQITTKGNRHIGAIIGSKEYKKKYVTNIVQEWVKEIEVLSGIAQALPHAAYTSFVFGYQHKFTYLMRTVPDISVDLQPLEEMIRKRFLKSILN